MTTELLTIDMFSEKVGEVFMLEGAGTPDIVLTLSEVTALRNYANVPRAPFSLMFVTEGKPVMPQGMYDLRHATLGVQSFFLVPIGKDGGEVTYQAIFN